MHINQKTNNSNVKLLTKQVKLSVSSFIWCERRLHR